MAYVSVRGSTRDRWHAEIRIIGGGFNKGVINKSVGRNREPIQESADLKVSKKYFISTFRNERMADFWIRNPFDRS